MYTDPRNQTQNAPASVPAGEVTQCAADIGQSVGDLTSAIDLFEAQLRGVLQPPVPSPTKAAEGLRQAMQSPLGSTLQDHLFNLRGLVARVTDLTNRCQV